ncbi:hypothetical protein HI914_04610 [Erysiphe necator]|nr:hypothetical protein HI914_04610 [Erysiphe necator]
MMRYLIVIYAILAVATLVTSLSNKETFEGRNYRNSGYVCNEDVYFEAEIHKTASLACVKLKKNRISKFFQRYPRDYKPPTSLGIPVRKYSLYPLVPKVKPIRSFYGLGRRKSRSYILLKTENCQLAGVISSSKDRRGSPKLCVLSKLNKK